MHIGVDLSAGGCLTVPTWPSDSVGAVGFPDPFMGYDFQTAIYGDRDSTGGTYDTLGVEVYHCTGSAAAIPRTVSLPSSGNYTNCDDCVVLFKDQDSQGNPDAFYFAVGGSLKIT